MPSKIIINANLVHSAPAEITALLYHMFNSVEPGQPQASNDFEDGHVLGVANMFAYTPKAMKDPHLSTLSTYPSFMLVEGKLDNQLHQRLSVQPGSDPKYVSHVQLSATEGAQYQFVLYCQTEVDDAYIDGLIQFINPWLVRTDEPVAVLFPEYRDDHKQHTYAWVCIGEGVVKAKIEGSDVEHGFNQMEFMEVYGLICEAIPTAEQVELNEEIVAHNDSYGQLQFAKANAFNEAVTAHRQELVFLTTGQKPEFIQKAIHTCINKIVVEYVEACTFADGEQLVLDQGSVYILEMSAYEHINSLMQSVHYFERLEFKTHGNRTKLRFFIDNFERMFHNTPDVFNVSMLNRTNRAISYMGA